MVLQRHRKLTSRDDALADDEGNVSDRTELPPDVQRRVKVIQQLMAVKEQKTLRRAQQQAAQSLGIEKQFATAGSSKSRELLLCRDRCVQTKVV